MIIKPKKRRIYPEQIDRRSSKNSREYVHQARINMYEFTPSVSVVLQLKFTLQMLGFETDSSGEFLGDISYHEDPAGSNIRIYKQRFFYPPLKGYLDSPYPFHPYLISTN